MPDPTAMDLLDPAPPRPRQRRQRRIIGPVEKGVRADLKRLPDDMQQGGYAALALQAAETLDTVPMTPRDLAGLEGRLQQILAALHEMAPGERKGDKTDDLQERRNRRLAEGA